MATDVGWKLRTIISFWDLKQVDGNQYSKRYEK